MKFTIGPMVMGTGMILLAVSAGLLIAGLRLLIKLLRTHWNMAVNAFNAKFAYESSLRPSDMQQDSKRREIAGRLGIQAATPVAEREISIRSPKTEVMAAPNRAKAMDAEDRTEEL